MLGVDELTTRYGAVVALRGVSLHVDDGELVAVVGPNGAGKTTLLNTDRRAAPTGRRDGSTSPASTSPAPSRRRSCAPGLALVPEHRRIFRDLTVGENLAAGRHHRRPRRSPPTPRRGARQRFAVLADRWDTAAGYLSGGEAQQLAVARALMSDPRAGAARRADARPRRRR